MTVSSRPFRVSPIAALVALIGSAMLPAAAADQPPQQRPCRELTGEERTKCEQHARESDPSRRQTPPPAADEKEQPPPDTSSEGDEQSDTADPPQA
jgi:hypothetical protein